MSTPPTYWARFRRKAAISRVVTIVLCCFMLIGAAPLHVELPSVEIKLEGTAPSPAEKYKILLKAEGSLTSPHA